MDGIFTIEADGKERSFFVGSYCFMLCAKAGLDLNNMSERLKANIWETTAILAYSAAYAHAQIIEKSEPDFELTDVYSWLDQVGVTELLEKITTQMQSYSTKNHKAPRAGHSQLENISTLQ